MASTPDILTKLNVGSGMNNSEIITSLVDAERTPALERIEKNENSTKNKISAYFTRSKISLEKFYNKSKK